MELSEVAINLKHYGMNDECIQKPMKEDVMSLIRFPFSRLVQF